MFSTACVVLQTRRQRERHANIIERFGNLQPFDMCTCTSACDETGCENNALCSDCYDGNCRLDSCANRRFTAVVDRDHSAVVEERPSGIHGHGLFAINDILPKSVVINYEGEVTTKFPPPPDNDKVVKLQSGPYVNGAKGGNASSTVNHCCLPNAILVCREIRGEQKAFIVADERIEGGTEITIQYSPEYASYVAGGCKCPSW